MNNTDIRMLKIAITGGPCAGKSTALTWIRDDYEKRGWKVYIVGEVATSAAMGNAFPNDFKDLALCQAAIYKKQVADEKFFESIALSNAEDGDDILIVCDRGSVDGLAFLNDEEQERFHKITNTTRRSMMDQYDAVFHLVSAAIGAVEYYTLSNNFARHESVEKAALIDEKTVKAWTGHHHLRIIDNSTDFHDKMIRLLKEISIITGDSAPYEIERKFLIAMPNVEELIEHGAEKTEILQSYLNDYNGTERRLRQRGIKNIWSYTLTSKTNTENSAVRIETEKRLTEKEYLELLVDVDTSKHQIRKTRWCLPYQSTLFEIDIFPFSTELALMEVELSDTEEQFEIPEFIDVVREVTDDANYRNKMLAVTQKL